MAKKEKLQVKSHALMPKHTKLSEKDKKALLEQYGISVKQLPVIVSQDAAIAGLEVKDGDVIKIKRSSVTAGKTVFYRGVIDG